MLDRGWKELAELERRVTVLEGNAPMNIYVVNFTGFVEATLRNDCKVKTGHIHVVAESFEDALAAVREAYPDGVPQGISQSNEVRGLPILMRPPK